MGYQEARYATAHSQTRGTTKLIAIVIGFHADQNGEAWPSIKTLQAWTNSSERSVQRAIQALVEAGELVVSRPRPGRVSNTYRMIFRECECSRSDKGYVIHIPDNVDQDHWE